MRLHVPSAGVAAGALSIAATSVAALAASADTAGAQAQRTPVLRAVDRVTAGKPARATGQAPGAAGRRVVLAHRVGAGPWQTLATTTVGENDRFAFRTRVPRSGVLRAAIAGSTATASAATASAATTNEQPIAVARAVRVGAHDRHVRAGRSTRVRGRIAPASPGVRVALQMRRGGRWAAVDRARTRAGGRYELMARGSSAGTRRLRVRTSPGNGFVRGRRGAGRLHTYRVAYASWYGPGFYGRPLGCSGAPLQPGQLGVAHKTLPCGSRVTLRHRGRSVTVRVIDRGPYVAGREYDLTEATKDRLGFGGHGPVLATR